MEAIWENYYQTGIPEIDKQHKELLMVARRIITIIDQEDSQIRRMFAATEGIKYLKSYMFQHFADEEAYMKKTGYKDYEKHKQEHDHLKNVVIPEAENLLIKGNYSRDSFRRFMSIGFGTLVDHIISEDMGIVGKVKISLNGSGCEQSSAFLADIVQNLLSGLVAGLTASPLKLNYCGTDLGKAVYYEGHYSDDGHEETIYIIIENSMFNYILEKLLNHTITETTQTLLSLMAEFENLIFSYISHIFTGTPRDSSKYIGAFITREAFEVKTEGELPEFSVLLGTNVGKIAVCLDV